MRADAIYMNARKLINELKVIEWDITGETVDYVLVEENEENVGIIKAIVSIFQSDYNIEEKRVTGGTIDISQLGFEFGNWWSESDGFHII